jgi:hypothetical protein
MPSSWSPSSPLVLQTHAVLDVSAASGIAVRGEQLFVIADDELDLAVYDREGKRVGRVTLRMGQLPVLASARKAQKPDYEALLSLPDDSLLVLGSGSTAQRMEGAWVRFERNEPRVQTIDLRELYDTLSYQLPQLNIEGGTVQNDRLYLCNRGNGQQGDNALISLDLYQVLQALKDQQRIPRDALLKVQRVELGALGGVALGLTDLTVMHNTLLFSAAAEASVNSYEDGPCPGSVLGMLSASGQVRGVVPVSPGTKIEGLCAAGPHDPRTLLAVADADDRTQRSPLFSAQPWTAD